MKDIDLNEERGRETSFTLIAAKDYHFFIFFFAAKFEHNFLSLVEIKCNADIRNFAVRFIEQIPVSIDKL